MVTAERLKESLRYDEGSGLFSWIKTGRRNIKSGDLAGHIDRQGYVQIMLDGKMYLAHRLAWFYVTGEWPKHQIDHIDGNKGYNAFSNLRDVVQAVNMQNQGRPQRSNKSGFRGVSFEKATNKWRADISANGKRTTIGRFDTPELAYEHYLGARRTMHDAGGLNGSR